MLVEHLDKELRANTILLYYWMNKIADNKQSASYFFGCMVSSLLEAKKQQLTFACDITS